LTFIQLSSLDKHFQDNSYAVGYVLSSVDSALIQRLLSKDKEDLSELPHLTRWLLHVQRRLACGESPVVVQDKIALEAFETKMGQLSFF